MPLWSGCTDSVCGDPFIEALIHAEVMYKNFARASVENANLSYLVFTCSVREIDDIYLRLTPFLETLCTTAGHMMVVS
jgi:hypothetical protein